MLKRVPVQERRRSSHVRRAEETRWRHATRQVFALSGLPGSDFRTCRLYCRPLMLRFHPSRHTTDRPPSPLLRPPVVTQKHTHTHAHTHTHTAQEAHTHALIRRAAERRSEKISYMHGYDDFWRLEVRSSSSRRCQRSDFCTLPRGRGHDFRPRRRRYGHILKYTFTCNWYPYQ